MHVHPTCVMRRIPGVEDNGVVARRRDDDGVVAGTDEAVRADAFTSFAEAMQEEGPFVPLIVPGRNIATADAVSGAVYNSVWEMDIAEITPAG